MKCTPLQSGQPHFINQPYKMPNIIIIIIMIIIGNNNIKCVGEKWGGGQ